MILAKHVLTVYQKYMNQGEWTGGAPPVAQEAWNRTVIKYAQWEDLTDRNADTSGKNFIDKHISIIIPMTANTGGKKYVKPIQWAALTQRRIRRHIFKCFIITLSSLNIKALKKLLN